jgi:hypothetical protein
MDCARLRRRHSRPLLGKVPLGAVGSDCGVYIIVIVLRDAKQVGYLHRTALIPDTSYLLARTLGIPGGLQLLDIEWDSPALPVDAEHRSTLRSPHPAHSSR